MLGRLVIRADAGPGMGAGHVMRMIALGEAWRDGGGSVTFVSDIAARALQDRIHAEGFSFEAPGGTHPEAADNEFLLNATTNGDRIVLDGYHFDENYMMTLHDAGRTVIVMDDINDRERYPVSAIVNQNVDAEEYEYEALPDTLVLRGPRYALLRSEFLNCKTPCTDAEPDVTNVLVSFGGEDSGNRTAATLEALKGASAGTLRVRVVLGALYRHGTALENILPSLPFECVCSYSVDNMPELMAWADVAIGAAGSTCWEMCHLGLPMLLAVVADNQRGIADGLARIGVARVVDSFDVATVASFLGDFELRNRAAALGPQMIDGLGSKRLAKAIISCNLTLRKASADDWEHLLAWRNDPVSRRFSFQSGEVGEAGHRAWLAGKLVDDNCLFLIAEDLGVPAGQVRFDVEGNEMTVSLAVAPPFRGRGIGKVMLAKACNMAFTLFPRARVVALVKKVNVSSVSVFEGSGFVEVDILDKDGEPVGRYELVGRENERVLF